MGGFHNNYGSFSFQRPFDSDDKPLHISLSTLEIQFKKAQQTLRELVFIPVSSGEGRNHLAAQFNQKNLVESSRLKFVNFRLRRAVWRHIFGNVRFCQNESALELFDVIFENT